MNHREWIGKTLGEFVDYLNSHHSYAIGFYEVNHSISLNEVIGLCVYDSTFINKYYNQTIVDITGSDYNYNIKIRKIK